MSDVLAYEARGGCMEFSSLDFSLLFYSKGLPSMWSGVFRRSYQSKLGVMLWLMVPMLLKGDGGLSMSVCSQWL